MISGGCEVCILDSGSTDDTLAIATDFGCKIGSRTFTNHAEQKNAALAMATRPWVLSIDADEVVSPEQAKAILAAVGRAPADVGGYRLTRRLVFMGRPMRFGKAVDHPVRLARREGARFESAIHEQLIVKGRTADLYPGELLHYSYDDLTDYFARFNDYTTRIALNHQANNRSMPTIGAHVLRPWWEFVSRYFLRLGFLDGYPGYVYALLSSFYTFVKYAKLKELCSSKPHAS
jgi:glycosyltransferase involved in cell wall biosynthesis